MALKVDDFRAGLSRFASGVTVITTRGAQGQPAGFTATSFASVSLDPPLVLFCLDNNSNSMDAFTACETFAVNILSSRQQEISNRFASKNEDKFDGIPYRSGELNLPMIEGALAGMECRLREKFPGGDHLIFVGEVEHVYLEESPPLIYFTGKYRDLTPE